RSGRSAAATATVTKSRRTAYLSAFCFFILMQLTSCSARPACGSSFRLPGDLQAVADFLLKPSNEPRCDHRLVAAGAKRVGPLPVCKAGHQLARPTHVARRNASSNQLLMPAVIAELHESVCDRGDEPVALEQAGVAALRLEPPGLAQRCSKITDDVPAVDAVAWLRHLVQRVVVVLEVGA